MNDKKKEFLHEYRGKKGTFRLYKVVNAEGVTMYTLEDSKGEIGSCYRMPEQMVETLINAY